jgi:hypothetical protein
MTIMLIVTAGTFASGRFSRVSRSEAVNRRGNAMLATLLEPGTLARRRAGRQSRSPIRVARTDKFWHGILIENVLWITL